MRISCFGSGSGKEGEGAYVAMMEVGRLLAGRGVTVMTGGFGGTGMEAAPRGAKMGGGISIGYTLAGKPGNPHLTEVVDCHALASSIPFWADFGVRLCGLMQADGFVIAAGGGTGTAIELLTIVEFNRKVFGKFIPGDKRRVAILKPSDINAPSWDNQMLDTLAQLGFLGDPDERIRDLIKVCDTPREAINWVLEGK